MGGRSGAGTKSGEPSSAETPPKTCASFGRSSGPDANLSGSVVRSLVYRLSCAPATISEVEKQSKTDCIACTVTPKMYYPIVGYQLWRFPARCPTGRAVNTVGEGAPIQWANSAPIWSGSGQLWQSSDELNEFG